MLINQSLFEDDQGQDQVHKNQEGSTQMGFFSFNNTPTITTLINNSNNNNSNNPKLVGCFKTFSSSTNNTNTASSSSLALLKTPCSLSISDIAILPSNNNYSNIENPLSPDHHSHGFITGYFGTETQPLSLRRLSTADLWSWAKEVSESMESKLMRSSIYNEDHDHEDDHHDYHQQIHRDIGVSVMKMKKIKGGRRKVREPRFCFKTMTEVDVLDDGYKWRKYGQKVVKNTQHPRALLREKKRKERKGAGQRKSRNRRTLSLDVLPHEFSPSLFLSHSFLKVFSAIDGFCKLGCALLYTPKRINNV